MKSKPQPPLVTDHEDAVEGLVFDAGFIDRVEVTDSGFVRAPGRVTKTGVFVYVNKDGSLRRELRLPEEVFATDSLRTLAMVPITREHPTPIGTAVTVHNRKEFSVGALGSDVRREGEHIVATLQVEDALAIEDVSSGKRRELSAGYSRRLELKPGITKGIPGVPDGIPYDGIQRNIRYNHVALTVSGRAGPDTRIRLDSNAAVMVCDASDPNAPPAPEARPVMKKITIDGITYEIDCEDSTLAVITKAISDRDSKLTSTDSKVVELQRTVDTERARADIAEAALKKAEALVTDSSKPERLQELVKARLELERTAKPLLADSKGVEPDLADLSDEEIKRKVVLVADSEAKLDGASTDYLNGLYVGAVRELKKAAAARVAHGNLRPPAPQPGAKVVVDSNDSRRKLREESEHAWQKPFGYQAAAEK